MPVPPAAAWPAAELGNWAQTWQYLMTDESPSEQFPGSWAAAQAHLVAATRQLPEATGSADVDATYGDLVHFLKRNELEPALALAVALGDMVVAPRSFWVEVLAAARTMELSDQVLLISARVGV